MYLISQEACSSHMGGIFDPYVYGTVLAHGFGTHDIVKLLMQLPICVLFVHIVGFENIIDVCEFKCELCRVC